MANASRFVIRSKNTTPLNLNAKIILAPRFHKKVDSVLIGHIQLWPITITKMELDTHIRII
jgi:hypothetical protein